MLHRERLPRIPHKTCFLFIPAFLLLAAGCSLQSRKRPLSREPASEVLPITTGGIVAVKASGLLRGGFEATAQKLLAWEAAVGSQPDTLHALIIDEKEPAKWTLPEDAARITGKKEIVNTLQAWGKGEAEQFKEALALLESFRKKRYAPAALCTDPAEREETAGLQFGLNTFKSSQGIVLVLGDIRTRQEKEDAFLMEIHFHVSQSYAAGLNLYHLQKKAEGTLELSISLLSWIRQVEGLFGAIPRQFAEKELLKQVKTSWFYMEHSLTEAGG